MGASSRRSYGVGFNTQPPEGGWVIVRVADSKNTEVSTHSRLKAAGAFWLSSRFSAACFNTQPPEGGWLKCLTYLFVSTCFNTQPPEGGWCFKIFICQVS